MVNSSLELLNMSHDQPLEKCSSLDYLAWRETYLTADVHNGLLATMIINSITAMLTIILNALVIAAVIAKREMRSNYHILLAFLAGADFTVGALVQPLVITGDIKRILSTGSYCYVDCASILIAMFSCLASLNHLTLISIERYVAIRYPLRHLDIVTGQRLKAGILLAWALSVLETLPYTAQVIVNNPDILDDLIYADVAVIGVILMKMFVLVYTNAFIFSETERQKKRARNEQVPPEEAKRLRNERRAGRTVTIILGAFLLSYVPVVTIMILGTTFAETLGFRHFYVVCSFSFSVLMLGSLLNPFIYFLRLKGLRHALLDMLNIRLVSNVVGVAYIEYPGRQQPVNLSLDFARQGPASLSFSTLETSNRITTEESHQ